MDNFKLFKCFFKTELEKIKSIKKQHKEAILELASSISMLLYTHKKTTENDINLFLDDYINNYIELTAEEIVILKEEIRIKLKKYSNMEE